MRTVILALALIGCSSAAATSQTEAGDTACQEVRAAHCLRLSECYSNGECIEASGSPCTADDITRGCSALPVPSCTRTVDTTTVTECLDVLKTSECGTAETYPIGCGPLWALLH